MQRLNESYVQVKKFSTANKDDEYFLSVKAGEGIPFREQVKRIEQEYFDALKALNIDKDSVIYRKIFVSDIASQGHMLKESCLCGDPSSDTKAAVSLVEQMPLGSSEIAMFAYHLVSSKGIDKISPSKDCLFVKREDVSQLWFTNLTGYIAGNDDHSASIREQTKSLMSHFMKEIAGFNASLKENTMRTWFYIKDIYRDYQDMVNERREIFHQQGLTFDTHFIASTGIGGNSGGGKALVSMDALSLLGVRKEQISYLNAPGYLCNTFDYGVTFERGVRVSFRDRAHLHISGTASIDKFGEVVNKGDVIKQTARTFENIQALLRNGNADLKDLMYIIVYLCNPSDMCLVKDFLSNIVDNIPYVIVQAPICRPEWLVEIEGLAIIKNNDSRLPDF